MMGNVFTTVSEKEIKHYYLGNKSNPTAWIEVENPQFEHEWYWPGHGFVRNNNLFVFMSKFYKVKDELLVFNI